MRVWCTCWRHCRHLCVGDKGTLLLVEYGPAVTQQLFMQMQKLFSVWKVGYWYLDIVLCILHILLQIFMVTLLVFDLLIWSKVTETVGLKNITDICFLILTPCSLAKSPFGNARGTEVLIVITIYMTRCVFIRELLIGWMCNLLIGQFECLWMVFRHMVKEGIKEECNCCFVLNIKWTVYSKFIIF